MRIADGHHRLSAEQYKGSETAAVDFVDLDRTTTQELGAIAAAAALAHVERYRAAGFDRQGLTASGLLGRRVSPTVAAFNQQWWDELQQWGGRDQGSIDFCAWANAIRVFHIPGTVRNNRMARWRDVPAVVA